MSDSGPRAPGYVGSRWLTALLANHNQVLASTPKPQASQSRSSLGSPVFPVRLDASDPVSAWPLSLFQGLPRASTRGYSLVHGIGQPVFPTADRPRPRTWRPRPGAVFRHRLPLRVCVPPTGAVRALAIRAEVADVPTVEDGPGGVALARRLSSRRFRPFRFSIYAALCRRPVSADAHCRVDGKPY